MAKTEPRWAGKQGPEAARERDQLVTLKVMRLTRPAIKPLLHVINEEQDLPGDIFKKEILGNISAVKGAEQLTSGELLSLPQSFGSIFLGETFSCYVSVLNDSNQVVEEVAIKTDLQTTSQRFQLTASKPRPQLSPDESVDEVIDYEVKELGTHILICAVNYTSNAGEKLYMRRFYKFQVLKPLEVKTKFYNATNDAVFLEAQVQNITNSPMCMENVSLEPSQYYSVKSLNDVPTSKSTEDDAPTRDSTTTFGSTYLNHEDTRQYLYLLTPKENLLKELKSKPYSPIGKLDIVWRTNFGESGRLQTSQLQRIPPAEQDVKLVPKVIPDVVALEKQFHIKCRLENSGDAKMEVKLFLTNPEDSALLWCGISGKVLGPLPPGAFLDLDLSLISIAPGLHTISGVRILDMNTTKTYEFDDIAKILVYGSKDCPFR